MEAHNEVSDSISDANIQAARAVCCYLLGHQLLTGYLQMKEDQVVLGKGKRDAKVYLLVWMKTKTDLQEVWR